MERVNTSGRTIELAPAHSANANTVAAIRTTGTLTDVIRQHRIDRIDLLKIDVEESELDVLAGIADGDWSKIKQVVIEVESKRNLDLVVAKLKEHEYQVFVDKVDHGFSSDSPAPSHSYPNGDIDGDEVYMLYGIQRRAPDAQSASNAIQAQPVIMVAPPGSALSAEELSRHLMESLPEYMSPSAFVLLDKLPMLTNGKVNRKALPPPDQLLRRPGGEYIAPRNEIESTVAGVFAEVLGVDRVGAEDNFFSLGGHSLLAMQVVSRILEKLEVELPVQTLFERPTVGAVSRFIASDGSGWAESPGPITRVNRLVEEELLERLDRRADEEVDELLRDVAGEERGGQ